MQELGKPQISRCDPCAQRFNNTCLAPRVVIPPTTQKHQKSMEHSDMEALGFQLRDYYEEVE